MAGKKICKCVAMTKALEALGVKDSDDWPTHFKLEEKHILPLLPARVSDKIVLEHEMMLAQKKIYGEIVNNDLLVAHANYEDDMVIEHLPHLLDEEFLASVGVIAVVDGRSRVRRR